MSCGQLLPNFAKCMVGLAGYTAGELIFGENLMKKMMLLFGLFVAIKVGAQPGFTLLEGFEDFDSLTNNGWIFANLSDQPEDDWQPGGNFNFPAQSGSFASYIFSYLDATGGDVICNWLILPNQGDIDQLRFFTRKGTEDDQRGDPGVARLAVVYSDNPNQAPEACPEDGPTRGLAFAEFEVLELINPNQLFGVYPTEWTAFTVDVNGPGRLALVHWITGVDNSKGTLPVATVAIDTVSVSRGGNPPAGPQRVPSLGFFALLCLILLLPISLWFSSET